MTVSKDPSEPPIPADELARWQAAADGTGAFRVSATERSLIKQIAWMDGRLRESQEALRAVREALEGARDWFEGDRQFPARVSDKALVARIEMIDAALPESGEPCQECRDMLNATEGEYGCQDHYDTAPAPEGEEPKGGRREWEIDGLTLGVEVEYIGDERHVRFTRTPPKSGIDPVLCTQIEIAPAPSTETQEG